MNASIASSLEQICGPALTRLPEVVAHGSRVVIAPKSIRSDHAIPRRDCMVADFILLQSRRFCDVLVARWVRVVSAARRVITWRVITWRVISTGRSSTEGGGADGSTYRHSRTYTTIIATAVNTTAIDATTIDATTIVCGRVS
jgi:hypothetical protein